MPLLILRTFCICASLLAWILLSLLCVFLFWRYREGNHKQTLLSLSVVSVLWLTVAGNTWYAGFFLLQKASLVPSLNGWVPVLLLPLCHLYREYLAEGEFPDWREWLSHLSVPAVLLAAYAVLVAASPLPDKTVGGWAEFLDLFPSWWMCFRGVCCAVLMVQLYFCGVRGRLVFAVTAAVVLMNVLTSASIFVIVGNLLFAGLSIYFFHTSLLYHFIRRRLGYAGIRAQNAGRSGWMPDTGGDGEAESVVQGSGARGNAVGQLSPAIIGEIHRLLDSPEFIHDPRLTLKRMAREVGVNASYVSRYFNQCLGSSFPEYVTELRLRDAEVLLRDTDKRVSDICEEVGLNLSRFYVAFGIRNHLPPLQWRKLARMEENKKAANRQNSQ